MFETHHFIDNNGAAVGALVFGTLFGIYGLAVLFH